MGVRRSGFDVQAVTVFTDHGDGTAGPDDYTEYRGVQFEQSEATTLQIPIDTAEDTQPEHDETFAIGFWDAEVWHGCVVTIVDDDEPHRACLDFQTLTVVKGSVGRLAVTRLLGGPTVTRTDTSKTAMAAVLELAASLCTASDPICSECPLKTQCHYGSGRIVAAE